MNTTQTHPQCHEHPNALSDTELMVATDHLHQMVDASGPLILEYFRTRMDVDNKLAGEEFDPVTIADKEAELCIREKIKQLRPADGILGEEHGFESGTSGFTWIIDPIDGTRAFISGLPMWGTLISLYDGTHSILGVMDQPYTEERFFGSRMGAYFTRGKYTQQTRAENATQLKVRVNRALSEAVLLTTSPDIFTPEDKPRFDKLGRRVATVRYGTDCYGYAMLAAGHVDLVVESELYAYDIQPLIPIVEAAGGMVTDWQGGAVKAGGHVLAASSPELHAAALEHLN